MEDTIFNINADDRCKVTGITSNGNKTDLSRK